jgi:phosphatidylserine/phosphatidylglycerophosphate/cardiolipin synthase-like enzyme
MRLSFLVILLCFLASPGFCLSIVEFYPDTYLPEDADEYLILEGGGVLDGITLSDGEGGFRFPENTVISGRITIAREGIAYRQVHGDDPDFEVLDTSPAIPDVVRGGRFQMSNTGDQLFLYQHGQLIQEISWPEELSAREGQVHYYEGGSWDPRPLLIGQSRFTALTVENVTLTAFVSPDSSYSVFARAVSEAKRSLWINVYEFSSMEMASLLIDARERGIEERLLLEGGPVGGILPEEHCALQALADRGAFIQIMETRGTAHVKYQFDHAKYLIVDDSGVLLASENFNNNGFPLPDTSGNRGWGVYIHNPQVTAYFRMVFDWDSEGEDIAPFSPAATLCSPVAPSAYKVEFPSREFDDARVTTVLAPDTSRLITEMIRQATESVDIEQAYFKNYSHGNPNPFMEEAIDAARRGVVVRVLLDSSWFNVNEPRDNDEMTAYINEVGRTERIPLSARCADLQSNRLDKIHNKGVIVDGDQVLVSSINWNEQSALFNREAGVIIDHPGVGAYYRAVFEDDWNASAGTPAGGMVLTRVAVAVLVISVLCGWYVFRIRR